MRFVSTDHYQPFPSPNGQGLFMHIIQTQIWSRSCSSGSFAARCKLAVCGFYWLDRLNLQALILASGVHWLR